MNRNFLFVATAAAVLVVVALGYQSYRERQETTVFRVDVGDGGVSVQTK